MTISTYEAGLLQSKAYRLLKNYVGKTLASYNLTTAEWALAGHLSDKPKGLRLADLSTLLSVEPPLVTRLVDSLEKQNVVGRLPDPDDRRARRICLTDSGKGLVVKVEQAMRESMKELLHGVPVEDIMAYTRVLQAICRNAVEG